jgi:peptide/nickel transport system substrate-binding protein
VFSGRSCESAQYRPVRVVVLSLMVSAAFALATAEARSVTVRSGGMPNSFDPAKVTDSRGYMFAAVLYDRLLSVSADGTLVPALAESWEATADTATLKIKAGVTCSDGTELTASEVAASLVRMGAKATNAPFAYRTIGTDGYAVTSDDTARTVSIKMNQPFSDLLLGLAMPWASIVCPAGLLAPERLEAHPTGSGPYALDEGRSVRGDHYTLVRRDGYDWGENGMTTADPGVPEEIVVHVIDQDATTARELIAGRLDVGDATGPDVPGLKADPSLTWISRPVFGMFFLMMQHADGHATADPQVRRAIATAIDRDAAMRAETDGSGLTATSFIGPGVPCYDPKTRDMLPPPDSAAAKAILRNAGWVPGSDGTLQKDGNPLRLRVLGWNLEARPTASEYIRDVFRSIGATVELRNMALKEMFDSALPGADWDVALFSFGPPMPTPNAVAGYVSSAGRQNWSHIDNADFVAARKAALAAAPDSHDRCAHWAKAQEALLRDFDILPLFADVGPMFARKGITLRMQSPYVIDLASVRVSD